MLIRWIMIPVLGAAVLGSVLLVLLLSSNPRARAVLKALVMVPVVFVLAVAVLATVARISRVRHHGPPPPRPSAAPMRSDLPSDEPVRAVANAAEPSSWTEIELSPDPDRPTWVDAPAQQVDGVYRVPVAAGPYATRAECERDLPNELRDAVQEYVGLYLGPEALDRVELPMDYIRQHVVETDWLETRQVTVSPTKQIPMVQLHVLLGFDREVNARIDEAWHRAVVHGKLWILGTVGVVVLLMLSAVWAYLRTDLATGGVYRGRLRFATGLAVVMAVLAGLAVLG